MKTVVFEPQGQREAAPEELPGLLANSRAPLWVDMVGPTPADLEAMQTIFDFHPLAIEDTHNFRQRPKVEDYGRYLFIILNTIAARSEGVVFEELDVFLGDHYLVTVHTPQNTAVADAQARISRVYRTLAASVDHLFYALLDTVVDSYFPVLDAIEDEIDALGDRVMTAPDRDTLNRLFEMKRSLTGIWRVVWPQRELLNNLGHYREAFLEQEGLRYYLRDVTDHLLWTADMVNSLRDTLTGLMDLYMSATSNRLNVVVNRLTVFTVVIGLLTVISGFYGMNFAQSWPPFESGWGVPLVLSLMIVVAVGLLALLRWRRWF